MERAPIKSPMSLDHEIAQVARLKRIEARVGQSRASQPPIEIFKRLPVIS